MFRYTSMYFNFSYLYQSLLSLKFQTQRFESPNKKSNTILDNNEMSKLNENRS